MKRLIVNVEESPRELATKKSVCDIVADYTELTERVNFKVIHESGEVKEFTLEPTLNFNVPQ